MHPHPRQYTIITGHYRTDEALFATPHRFSFNGQERTDEIAGTGNHTTALYWEYDTRLGRRWNVDPVVKENEGSYLTFSGNPITQVDPLGNSATRYEGEDGKEITTTQDGQNDKKVVVLDEQKELFDIWMKVAKEKGVIDNPYYNNSLADELSKGYNTCKSYTEDNFEVTIGVQFGATSKVGPTIVQGEANVASFNLFSMSNVQIGDYKKFDINYFGEDGELEMQHDLALSRGLGYGKQRQRTGYIEGGNANDGQWINRYQLPFVEITKIERANIITIIYMIKQGASDALGIRIGASVGRGWLKRA